MKHRGGAVVDEICIRCSCGRVFGAEVESIDAVGVARRVSGIMHASVDTGSSLRLRESVEDET
jgi:hypothetical protein